MRIIKDPVVRKNEILAAAAELFIQNGYEKTTIEGIIRKLGIAKGCFYHYFPSKEKLFEECIDHLAGNILSAYLEILTDERKSAKQRLYEYVSYNFNLANKSSAENLTQQIHSKAFEQIHEQIMKDSVRQLTPVFIQLIEQGKTDKDFVVINAEFTAVAMLGAFQEIHEAYAHQHSLGREDQFEMVIDLMERMLQTKYC